MRCKCLGRQRVSGNPNLSGISKANAVRGSEIHNAGCHQILRSHVIQCRQQLCFHLEQQEEEKLGDMEAPTH